MPGGDRRGPRRLGPMTGRAAGYRGEFGVPGYANAIPGRGFGIGFGRIGASGRGFGGERGWRNMFYAIGQPVWMRFGSFASSYGYPAPYHAPDPKGEKQAWKNHADALQAEREAIKKRLSDIEANVTEQWLYRNPQPDWPHRLPKPRPIVRKSSSRAEGRREGNDPNRLCQGL